MRERERGKKRKVVWVSAVCCCCPAGDVQPVASRCCAACEDLLELSFVSWHRPRLIDARWEPMKGSEKSWMRGKKKKEKKSGPCFHSLAGKHLTSAQKKDIFSISALLSLSSNWFERKENANYYKSREWCSLYILLLFPTSLKLVFVFGCIETLYLCRPAAW